MTNEALTEAECMKVEEVTVACTEAVEEYKASNEFKNLVLDGMVVEQFG